MRSKLAIYVAVGLVAAVALVAGVVAVAGAGSSTSLPDVSASELMARMGQSQGQVQAVSGEVSWKNDLFGDLGSATDMAQLPAQSPLTSSGSGRIWVSDAGVRVESQGAGGDQVAGVSKATRTAWTYDSATNTGRRLVMAGDAPANEPIPSPSASMMTPAAIGAYLQQLAPYATVDVAGQGTVAGRAVYLLRMTPVADDTALGAVQASIDGKTMMPLRLEVFAKSGGAAVLQFGFDSVSYGPIDAALYDFTPPAGTTVTTKTIDLGQAAKSHQGEPTKAQQEQMQSAVRGALLTIPEAQKLVPFQLASAQGYTARPFDWAAVVSKSGPLNALDQPVMKLLGAAGMSGFGSATDGTATSATSTTNPTGPTAVLLYGKGFGTIALAETATTPALQKQIEQLPALLEVYHGQFAGTARSLTTPLGGAIIWQQGDTTLVAAGMVPKADLLAFVSSVR